MATKTQSLAHTKWLCKYHIVFTPKYRRKVIYNQYRNSLREILRRLCEYKGVKIIEGELMADHVQMLVLGFGGGLGRLPPGAVVRVPLG